MKKANFCPSRKASNLPTDEELKDGYLFADSGPFETPDITIILGSDIGGSYASILLCRFHSFDPKLSILTKHELFKDLWSSLNANKFECRRSGGSSGFISNSADNVIQKFMRQPGSTPRNGTGAVWIKGLDTWYVYYIGTYDGIGKECKYTNPVPGGSFFLNHRILKKHPFLLKFISTKPLAATIIQAIQRKLLGNDNFKVTITPQAVAEELRNIAETRQVILASSTPNIAEPPLGLKTVPKYLVGNDMFIFYAIYSMLFVKWTLVAHSVGLHKDDFKDGMASLENKMCVRMNRREISPKMLFNTHPHGRGGGSSDEFVFAILDWSGGHRSRRRIWTHPANALLENAPTNPNQHITRTIWDAFWVHNNVFVPPGIDRNKLAYEEQE